MTERLSIPKCIFQCIFSDFTLLVLTNFSKENKEKKHHKCRGKKQTKYISKILRSVSFTYFCLSPRGSLQVQSVEVTGNFIYNFKSNIFNYLFTFISYFLPRCSLQEEDISCQFHPEGCGFKSPTSLFQHTMSMFGIPVPVTRGDPSRVSLYSASFRQMFACPARSLDIHTLHLFWRSLNTFLARATAVRRFRMWNGCRGAVRGEWTLLQWLRNERGLDGAMLL